MEEETLELEETEQEAPAEEAPQEPVEERKYTRVEQRALQAGWNPEGEDSAIEWLQSKDYRDIRDIRKRLEAAERRAQQSEEALSKTRREQLLGELRKTKRRVLEEAGISPEHVDTLDRTEQEIERLTKEPSSPAPPAGGVDPEFEAWQARNTWYDPQTNPVQWGVATQYGKMLIDQGKTPKEMLAAVENTPFEEMQRAVLGGARSQIPPPRVGASTRSMGPRQARANGPSWSTLTAEEKADFGELCRLGTFDDTAEGRNAYAKYLRE